MFFVNVAKMFGVLYNKMKKIVEIVENFGEKCKNAIVPCLLALDILVYVSFCCHAIAENARLFPKIITATFILHLIIDEISFYFK